VLWIAFVVIFHETLGWARFAPPNREAGREDRFQLSGAGWTEEDDGLLRSLIGSGKPPRAIALEMKRTVGGIRARTAKLGLRNNRLGDASTGCGGRASIARYIRRHARFDRRAGEC